MFCLKSDLVVFEAKNSEAFLVVQHLCERVNAVVVNLVVVQIELLETFVVDHGLAQADQTQVANQVGLQTQTHKAEQRVLAHCCDFSGATLANVVVGETQSPQVDLVRQQLSNHLGALTVDLVGVKV